MSFIYRWLIWKLIVFCGFFGIELGEIYIDEEENLWICCLGAEIALVAEESE